jgi:hypothetical protein
VVALIQQRMRGCRADDACADDGDVHERRS